MAHGTHRVARAGPVRAGWPPVLAALLLAGGAAGIAGAPGGVDAASGPDGDPTPGLFAPEADAPDSDSDSDAAGAAHGDLVADPDAAATDEVTPPFDVTPPEEVTPPRVEVRTASLEAASPPERTAPPLRLVIPDVGIDMQVGPVGVGADGQMAIPADVDDVGWYRYGPSPGDPRGAAVLASHVDSWAEGAGPFARLRHQVVPGTRVNVYAADGSVRSFEVVDNRLVPKPELPVDVLFDRSGPPRLVLVTCGGRFQRDVGRYTDNVVVTAVPVRS